MTDEEDYGWQEESRVFRAYREGEIGSITQDLFDSNLEHLKARVEAEAKQRPGRWTVEERLIRIRDVCYYDNTPKEVSWDVVVHDEG